MNKLEKNESGFSVLEVLLILTVITAVGFIGWFVWHNKVDDKKSNDSVTSANKASSDTKDTDTNNDNKESELVKIQSSNGFSFSYPKAWSVVAYSNNETINGGQVNADDVNAVQWRIWSKATKTKEELVNVMCVDLTVSTLHNAGVLVDNLKKVSSGLGEFEIWNGTKSSETVTVLRNMSSTDNFITLGSDTALTAYASYNCAQGMSTSYSATEQTGTDDYKTAVEVLRSIKLN